MLLNHPHFMLDEVKQRALVMFVFAAIIIFI